MAWNMGLLGVVQNTSYWIAVSGEYNPSIGSLNLIATTTDSARNIYVIRNVPFPALEDAVMHLTKFSPNGDVQDEATFDTTLSQNKVHSFSAIDGSLYASLGDTAGSAAAPSSIIKVSSDTLNRDYHLTLGSTEFLGSPADCFSVPGEPDHVYFAGRSRTNSFSIGMAKVLKSNGSLTWAKSTTTPEVVSPMSAGVYSGLSGNIVLLGGDRGTTPNGGSQYMGNVVSINPATGSAVKYKRFVVDETSTTTEYTRVWAAATDRDGYIYASGTTAAIDGAQKGFLTKINPETDSILWTRLIAGVGATEAINREMTSTTDKSGNTYVVFHNNYPRIVKFDSNGNTVWSRKINTEASALYPTSPTSSQRPIRVHSDENSFYISLIAYNSLSPYPSRAVTMKLPADGSLTGNYVVNSVSVDYVVDSAVSVSSIAPPPMFDLPPINNFSWADDGVVATTYSFTDSALNSSFIKEGLV